MDRDIPARIALKLRVPLPYKDGAEEFLPPSLREQWERITADFPGITLWRLFTSLTEAELQGLIDEALSQATALGMDYEPAGLQRCFVVECPEEVVPEALADALSRWDSGVEFAYIESGPTPPPSVDASNEPRRPNQFHLDAAPMGVHAQHAWSNTINGIGGSGVKLVDIEQGWNIKHQDLPPGLQVDGGNIVDCRGHGTAVLGICVARQSPAAPAPGVGGIGIAPRASIALISQWRPGSGVQPDRYNTADAITKAQNISAVGDVILIEAQAYFEQLENVPVEVEPCVWLAINTAVAAGRVVVEAAGNGNRDLDSDSFVRNGQRYLERDPGTQRRRRDSGAILVAGGTSTLTNLRVPTNGPHLRWGGSNYGSGVDCFGWGEDVDTSGGSGSMSTLSYSTNFSGTSAAAAMIAGVAVLVQARAKALHGSPLSPMVLRDLVSNHALGTMPDPLSERIGCMPDLARIWPHI